MLAGRVFLNLCAGFLTLSTARLPTRPARKIYTMCSGYHNICIVSTEKCKINTSQPMTSLSIPSVHLYSSCCLLNHLHDHSFETLLFSLSCYCLQLRLSECFSKANFNAFKPIKFFRVRNFYKFFKFDSAKIKKTKNGRKFQKPLSDDSIPLLRKANYMGAFWPISSSNLGFRALLSSSN